MVPPVLRRRALSCLVGTVLWFCVVVVGCAQPADDEVGDEGGSGESHGAQTLTPPDPPGPDEAAERLVLHFANMEALAAPLSEFCDAAGRDLLEYLELVSGDFAAAADANLSAEDKRTVAEAYRQFSQTGVRCMSDPRGRAFAEALVQHVKPLHLEHPTDDAPAP